MLLILGVLAAQMPSFGAVCGGSEEDSSAFRWAVGGRMAWAMARPYPELAVQIASSRDLEVYSVFSSHCPPCPRRCRSLGAQRAPWEAEEAAACRYRIPCLRYLPCLPYRPYLPCLGMGSRGGI